MRQDLAGCPEQLVSLWVLGRSPSREEAKRQDQGVPSSEDGLLCGPRAQRAWPRGLLRSCPWEVSKLLGLSSWAAGRL